MNLSSCLLNSCEFLTVTVSCSKESYWLTVTCIKNKRNPPVLKLLPSNITCCSVTFCFEGEWIVKHRSPLPNYIRIYTTISNTFSFFSFPWCSVFTNFPSSRRLFAHHQSPHRSLFVPLLCTVLCTKQILCKAVANGCCSSWAWRAPYRDQGIVRLG